MSTVFQILGRRADSLRIGLYTNFFENTARQAHLGHLLEPSRNNKTRSTSRASLAHQILNKADCRIWKNGLDEFF